jgi:hypothetical protein
MQSIFPKHRITLKTLYKSLKKNRLINNNTFQVRRNDPELLLNQRFCFQSDKFHVVFIKFQYVSTI